MLIWKNAKLIIPAVKHLSIIPTAFNQDYMGDITIVPHICLRDYLNMVSNPTPELISVRLVGSFRHDYLVKRTVLEFRKWPEQRRS